MRSTTQSRRALASLLFVPCIGAALVGCNRAELDTVGESGSEPANELAPDAAACRSEIREVAVSESAHLEACSQVTYSTSPPAGGSHYGLWLSFGNYDFPVPHGFVVHSLEHGAVALWYNCPDGCEVEVEAAQALLDRQPEDPACSGSGVKRRTVLLPDPTLSSRWAASAWGWTLNSSCFDEEALEDFLESHYGNAPEDLCAPGQEFESDPCE